MYPLVTVVTFTKSVILSSCCKRGRPLSHSSICWNFWYMVHSMSPNPQTWDLGQVETVTRNKVNKSERGCNQENLSPVQEGRRRVVVRPEGLSRVLGPTPHWLSVIKFLLLGERETTYLRQMRRITLVIPQWEGRRILLCSLYKMISLSIGNCRCSL